LSLSLFVLDAFHGAELRGGFYPILVGGQVDAFFNLGNVIHLEYFWHFIRAGAAGRALFLDDLHLFYRHIVLLKDTEKFLINPAART